jgi:hypothetical protein
MADSNGLADLKAEESEVSDDDRIVSLGDIAEAAGLDSSSFFESASEPEPEEATEEVVETDEVEEEIEESEESDNPLATEYTGEEEINDQPKLEESDGVKKRIGKLIEARNKAEMEAEELKAKIAELESSTSQQAAPDPKGMDRFESIKDYKELQAREAEAEHLREWLLENPDGGEYTDITGSEHEVDYEQARRLMVETDRDLRKNIPLAAQRLQQREQNRQTAMQTFDWMKDTSSAEMREIQQVLNSNKFIKEYYEKDPYSVLTVAYAIEGIKAINAKKSVQPAKQVTAAPKAPAPSRANSVTRKKSTNKKSLLQQATTGSVEDAASYIESIL